MKPKQILLLAALLSCLGVWATPNLTNISFPSTVGKYHKFEVNFDLNQYLNPYDEEQINVWAEFISPSGKPFKVYGFYYEDWQKVDDGAPDSDEILIPTGQHGWKIRFSPNETGEWALRIRATDASGGATYPSTGEAHFTVTPTSEKGFISLANSRYLKYDSGDPYIPIGDSYPWCLVSPWRANANGKEKGTNITKHYLDGMAANGFTYNRFEINFFEGLSLYGRDFVLQKTFFNYYNQHDAWQLDEIMEYAKARGISFNLAIFAGATLIDNGGFRYLGPNDLDGIPDIIPPLNSHGDTIVGWAYGAWSLFNPYGIYQDTRYLPTTPDTLGECRNLYDFFKLPSAIAAQKRLFRYIVARWGYCTNLMAFELLDEFNSDGLIFLSDLNPNWAPKPSDWDYTFAEWHSIMYDYIKQIDPNKHLISSAMMGEKLKEQIIPTLDFLGEHWYTQYGFANAGGLHRPFEYDIADAIQRWNAQFEKPTSITEVGWWGTESAADPKLYELHNLLWSALFNGSMGLTAIWAHEEEVLGRGALSQFLGVGTFSRQLPLFTEMDIPLRINANGLKWEFLRDNFQDEIHGWVQDENFTFFSLKNGDHRPYLATFAVQDRPPLLSDSQPKDFQVSREGTYQVSWYNTQTGALHSSEQVESNARILPLTMPEELRNSTWADAAFIIKFVSGPPSLLVFPNPGDGLFNINIKHPTASQCSYQVFSNLGAAVLQGEVALDPESMTFSVDIAKYAAGVYHLAVRIGNETYTERLVKL